MDALATVTYAGTKKNLVESGMVVDQPTVVPLDSSKEGAKWKVTVVLEFPRDTDPFLKSTMKAAEAAIKYHCKKAGDGSLEPGDIEVEIVTEFKSKPRPEVGKMLPQVKNIIAVSSGKGGVGKSTVSANLAIALARLGYKVGLLDCDIFGPSMPKMFHVEDERPYAVNVDGRDLICPIEAYGIKMLSIGFFVSPDTATLWRGGMATNALKQLIADADWGELDYFILDTPPGTSDIHLTLLQTLAITGAVIVSTPQQVALADARKGIDMYRNEKVNVPILGLVENMAWFTPAELPENRYYIFGKEGCKQLAEEMNVPLLAQIPLVQSICESGDAGEPAATSSETATGLAFINLAQAVVTVVNKRNRELPKTNIVGVKKG
jgi:ATP-binding protein involved in chromosome partitioning